MRNKFIFSLLACLFILNCSYLNPVLAESLDRLSGQNRYETAAVISQQTFDKADTVILANGQSYVDALPASTLANILKSPILLTEASSIPSVTMQEIERLQPMQVILLGGSSAINETISTMLQQKYQVVRIGGTNRYHTSELICSHIQSLKTITKIALTTSIADAVASGSFRGDSIPLVLVDPANPSDFAAKLTMDKKIILGGESVFSQNLATYYDANVRIGGANRYDTSVLLAKQSTNNSGHILLVNGVTFIDALTVSTFAFSENAIMLLTETESIGPEVRTYLQQFGYNKITLIGGENAISNDVLEEKPTNGVDPNKPMVALTFDDGPSGYTARILDSLKENNGKGTFFVLGGNVDYYSDILMREFKEGHEIGNHSFGHPELTFLSESSILWELSYTDELIRSIIGIEPILMRAPYGAYDEFVQQVVYYPMIDWSLDTRDWESQNAYDIIDITLNYVEDGDIILMHDTADYTATAAETIIPALIDRGFQLVTVSQMFEAKGYTLYPGSVYHAAY